MIAEMRKMAQSTVYRIFLWTFLFMMAFGGGVAIFNFGDDNNWVIKIYKQTLTQPKFQSMLKSIGQQREMYRQKGFAMPHKNIQKETVQVALSGLLAQQAIKDLGIIVAPDFVDSQIQQQLQHLPANFFKADGQLDQEALKQALAPNTIEDFVSDMEIEVKNKLLFSLVDATAYVCEFETMLQYNSEFADKKYSYLTLPYQKYVNQAQSAEPSEDLLSKFYKQADIAQEFKTLERRSGTAWTFHAHNFGAVVSDQEVKQFYDKNKMQRFVAEHALMQLRILLVKPEANDQAAKAKIEEFFQTAQKNPEQFEELVKKFSQDSKTAAQGGLTPLFDKNDTKIERIVVETAFEQLMTDGQISAPLKTERGYELIQRVKKVPAKYKDFKSVEHEIKKELDEAKFKKRFTQDAMRIVTSAKYTPEALTKFIERYKGVKTELALDVRQSSPLFSHLFSMEEGRYLSFLNKNDGVILFCNKVEKSKLPALADVRSKVLDLYFQNQAHKTLKKQLALAFKDAQTMSMSDVAQKYDATLQKASFEYTDGAVDQSPILKTAQVAAKLKSMQFSGAMACAETKNSGILIKLDTVEPVNFKVFTEQKDHLGKVLLYMKLYQNKEGFIASLYRTAKLNNKIEIKPELLQFTKEV
jgi:hypothetical protein